MTGTLHIDDEGRLTNFSAQRYMLRDGKAVWKLAGGDIEYIDLVITKLKYNIERVY